MTLPNEMNALLQKEGGFATASGDMTLKSLDPFLAYGKTAAPKPRSGEVLVKVGLASINPSDVLFIQGNYGRARKAGEPAGFEGMGVVVASGGGLMGRFLKGKRVAFGSAKGGAWAQYVAVRATECIPLRKDVRDEDGAALIVNPLTAQAMFDIARRDGAQSFVASAGASQLGKLLAGLARDGGMRLISIVRRDSHIEPLKALGATHVLNSEAPGYTQALAEVLTTEKPRVFLDAVTGKQGADIFHAMGAGARWIVYGRLDPGETPIREPGQTIFLSKRIEGFWLTKWMSESSLVQKLAASRAVQARFASGKWKTDVAAIVPLAEAHARLPGLLAKANEGKVLLKP